MIWGKVIGAIFGFMLGARLGFLSSLFGIMLGIFVGDTFDKGLQAATRAGSLLGLGQRARESFFRATFSIMGYIAKSDGRVSEDEISIAYGIMDRLGLNDVARQHAIELFGQGKTPGFAWQATLQELQETCRNHRDVLQIFVEIQIEVAYADGPLTEEKKHFLLLMAEQLGFSAREFARLDAMHQARERFRQHAHGHQHHTHSQQHQYRQPPPRQAKASLDDAYKVLGVQANASDQDVKRAYRKLMSQHHPDKLVSKGLPEEMLQMATEKTQQIKAAYDQVVAARKQDGD